jgi:hypothetical protein
MLSGVLGGRGSFFSEALLEGVRDGDFGIDFVRARGVVGPTVKGEPVRDRDVGVGVVGVRNGSFCDDRDGG